MPSTRFLWQRKSAFNTLPSSRIKMVCFTVITVFAVVFYVLAIRATFQVSHTFSPFHCVLMVARERFELSSMAPKATMLGHYTTGLRRRNRFVLRCGVLRTVLFLISILECFGKRFGKVSGWLGSVGLIEILDSVRVCYVRRE